MIDLMNFFSPHDDGLGPKMFQIYVSNLASISDGRVNRQDPVILEDTSIRE